MTITGQTYTINIPVEVTREDLYNILWGAICQGSTYWLEDVTDFKGRSISTEDILTELIENNRPVTFIYPETDDDSELGKAYLIMCNLIEAIEKYVSQYGDCITEGAIDTCKIDSPSCDLILQYALFGEQVYG